ncbi:potassium transporter 11-like isoform X1 [Rhododendron vialii]|uniref:potassium transporter 11-like isoform X1 n=1 Tax=Rhododendron vialii TaxID=182163 RepID=UPI00265F42B4|nr:potassium transporter 11-like isoform X1 [Rhododendron vialii]
MASGVEMEEDGTENKGSMWVLEQKLDQPMDEEAGRLKNMYREKKFSALLLLRLSFQSLGVVYGDLGTSPLYVFYNTFPHGISDPEDIIGALSLIIYSLTLIPLLKYVFIVCKANDNGQGGTFALYSLLCRHAKIKTLPNQHRTDEELTTYSRRKFHELSFAAKTKRWLEKFASRKNALLILVLVGTCMLIGDGILTPAISVLSAAGGIKVDHPKMSNDIVVVVAVVILIGVFSMQHYGTDKVGWLFAPIVLLWFLLIGGIGIFNVWKYDSSVLKAFSPVYIYRYLRRGGKGGWISLGGIMLSITGTEALFADLAHFPVSAIRLAFTVVVFPCLLSAYSGQAAYLMKNQDHVIDAFYRSIPDAIYWPVFVVATLAAIVASQATISATFSIIKQALALGCFPRVKVVHTSKKFLGQIYSPDINWILMILCIAVTAGFKNQSQIGNAYGTAVVIVMLVTTLLMTLVMLLVWHCHWIIVLIFTTFSLLVECTYFSAVLFKINQGGWVPLVIAAACLVIMYVWHYGTVKRYEFEMHSKVSMAWILGLGPSLGLVRVPGVGLIYTELASGVPHIFSHFITNLPAIHSVVVFVCVKYLPVYTVPEDERFLVKRIGPKNFHMFRCVARYGYKDLHKKDDEFEKKLFDNLFVYIRLESMMEECSDSDEYSLCGGHQKTEQSTDLLLRENNANSVDPTASSVESIIQVISPNHSTVMSSDQISSQTEIDEQEFLTKCMDAGVVHILGNTVVRARRGSNICKRVAINYIYAFLRKICRENSVIFNLPHESLLNVGQIFSV